MPAAVGSVTQTWHDRFGAVAIRVVYLFNATTGLFANNPALTFENNTGRAQRIWVYLGGVEPPKNVDMPTGSGSVTRNQMTNFTDGLVTSYFDGGWTLDPSNF